MGDAGAIMQAASPAAPPPLPPPAEAPPPLLHSSLSAVIVIRLSFAGLEQFFELCQWRRVIATCLYFAGLELLFDLVSGARCLLFACIWQVWSNDSSLSVEPSDCYLLVFCSAAPRPWQWSPMTVLCLCFPGLEQQFDLVSGVR